MLFGKHLNKYYLRYIYLFLIGIAALVIIDIHHLVLPESLGKIVGFYDRAIRAGSRVSTYFYIENGITYDKYYIYKIINGIVEVGLLLLVGRLIFRFSLMGATGKIIYKFREEMFDKVERLSLSYYQKNKAGSILSWFSTDLEAIDDLLGWGTIMLIDGTFLAVWVLIKMVKLDLALTLVVAIPIVGIIIWGFFVEKFMSAKWQLRQEAFDKLYDFTQENFTGIRVIKAFVKETKEIHQFAKVAKNNADVNVDFARTSVLFDVMIESIIHVVMAIILGFGAWFVYGTVTGTPVVIFGHDMELSSEKLITFYGYFDTLIWPLIALGQIFSMRSRAKTSLKRISNFLDTPEDITNPENAIVLKDIKGNIRFTNFDFTYPTNNLDALKNINLEIKQGETIGIVGRIGCGKTTLVNSLLRLYNVKEGTLFIDDNDIMKCDLTSLRDSIAIVPQDNFLFGDKVANNIAFSDPNLSMEKIKDAAKFASVDDDIEHFKEGYNTISGERGVTLSGGQKQRISIARAYIKDSPILILDDSVSAVDTKTEEAILSNIKEQRKDKTTLVIASRVSTVETLDKILVLNEGTVEAFGTPHELEKISPTYQKMVYLQRLEEEVKGGKE